MAGDWMKIELELPDKPEVHAISGIVNKDPEWVVGALIKVWGWFDKHTKDGHAHGVTFSLPDRISGVTGFGEAMMFVGWLEQKDKTLVMPKFDRHTSESAKKRATDQKRQSKHRGKENAPVTNMSQVLCDENVTREEKRREDKNHPAESGTDPIWGFGLAWLGGQSMRAFLGKQVSQYGADVVSSALDKCMAQGNVVDPKSYFLKLLEGENKKPKAWVPGQKRDVRSYT